MGSVFRKTKTWAIPASAEITRVKGKTIATWRRRRGKTESAEVVTLPDGRQVIRVESGFWFAKYRNADGVVVTKSTGCRDRAMAEQWLNQREKDVDRVRAGVVSKEELRRVERSAGAIEAHVWDFLDTKICTKSHLDHTKSYLEALVKDCGWKSLSDMKKEDFESWLGVQARAGMSARTRNAYQTALVSFAKWHFEAGRLTKNPFARMPKAKVEADPRRHRRAFSEEEFQRLLEAATNAPERPALKVTGGKSNRPTQRLSGPERADCYMVLVGTGLRVGELAKIRVADLRLDEPKPGVDVPAAVDKRRKEAFIPLRPDLVVLIRQRIERLALTPADRIFDIPTDLIKRFNADCKRAGICKRDDRRETVDIHSLRKTFGTWLAKAGVHPKVAQALMRHEDIKMTMKYYTDLRLFDLQGAVEALPMVHRMVHQTGVPGVHQKSTDVNGGGETEGTKAVS
jgi:integrase